MALCSEASATPVGLTSVALKELRGAQARRGIAFTPREGKGT
jgi:hypothetical protein